MKQQIIFTTIIVLALSSQLVSAGSITDTYSSGDTLTATKMENIKAAVNDNNTRVTSIMSDIFSVTAAVATPRSSACPTEQRTTSAGVGRSANNVSCGSEFLTAPVSLPHGATVTAFRCTVFDTGAYDSSCYLYTDNDITMAQVSSTGTSGKQTISTTNITSAVINNTTAGYYIYFGINGNAPTTLVPIRAVVEYTRP